MRYPSRPARFLPALAAAFLLHCAPSHLRVEGVPARPEAVGGDTAALAVPEGWPGACQAVNLSYSMSAECGGRELTAMRFGYRADEAGFAKAFERMFPEARMEAARPGMSVTGARWFRAEPRAQGVADGYDIGFFLPYGKGLLAFHCAARAGGDSAWCPSALARLVGKGWDELGPILPDTSGFGFAGRDIAAGPRCRFLSARNYQCPGNGQLSWTESADTARAAGFLEVHRRSTLARNVQVTRSEEVACGLDSVPTRCRVVTYKVKGLAARAASLPELVAVYARARVREREVAAICSFYRDDNPLLCGEVLTLEGGFDAFLLAP